MDNTSIIKKYMEQMKILSDTGTGIRIMYITASVPFPLRWGMTEEFVMNYLRTKGYSCKRTANNQNVINPHNVMNHRSGRPDILAKNKDGRLWVEVKTGNDGLRKDQISWMVRHPEEKILVVYVDQVIEEEGDDELW